MLKKRGSSTSLLSPIDIGLCNNPAWYADEAFSPLLSPATFGVFGEVQEPQEPLYSDYTEGHLFDEKASTAFGSTPNYAYDEYGDDRNRIGMLNFKADSFESHKDSLSEAKGQVKAAAVAKTEGEKMCTTKLKIPSKRIAELRFKNNFEKSRKMDVRNPRTFDEFGGVCFQQNEQKTKLDIKQPEVDDCSSHISDQSSSSNSSSNNNTPTVVRTSSRRRKGRAKKEPVMHQGLLYVGPTKTNRPGYKFRQQEWKWNMYPHGVSVQNGKKFRVQIKQKGTNPTYPTFPFTMAGLLDAAMYRDYEAYKLWQNGVLIRTPKFNFDNPDFKEAQKAATSKAASSDRSSLKKKNKKRKRNYFPEQKRKNLKSSHI
mmetsp:Transcript_0/g.1  ORF Transcript_0/g.1 Transcript_0/m.1 type:complete len:370 (-) Transcript_0:151-1260(-)|eukprot:CAMPEP_0185280472 /NCGR_PEP_ID=MMETSP1359-20130426/66142_1 /TAXON_ID=552665 /ORGANISM="Bigelowiella longifila, Strain CCMP242" /LENGTH=369 /DNA_ID=CAMNT_0027875729 /DNA_START=129 /DNA_END=1238 /DNA_ORIENTATION=-